MKIHGLLSYGHVTPLLPFITFLDIHEGDWVLDFCGDDVKKNQKEKTLWISLSNGILTNFALSGITLKGAIHEYFEYG